MFYYISGTFFHLARPGVSFGFLPGVVFLSYVSPLITVVLGGVAAGAGAVEGLAGAIVGRAGALEGLAFA